MNMLPCVKRPIPRTGTDFLPFRASNGLFHARERCNRMAERVGNLNFARYQNSEPQLSPPCPYNRGYSCCLSLPSSHWSYLFTSPATFPALIVPNHLLESLPPSSATFSPFIVARHLRHPSPATFRSVSVARHLRPYISGDVFALYRRPSPPAIPLRRRFQLLSSPTTCSNPSLHLRQRFRPLSLPVTSGHSSPATFRSVSVARHLRPSLFGDVSSSYRSQPPARIPPSIFGNVFALYRCPSPPAIPLRRRFGAFPSPATSAHPSPATFPALIVPNHLLESLPPSSATFSPFIVARHLRPYISGDVFALYRRPSPPAIHLRQFLGEITVISISFAILRGFFIRVDPLICN